MIHINEYSYFKSHYLLYIQEHKDTVLIVCYDVLIIALNHKTPTEYLWNLSYHLVLQLSQASSIILMMCSLHQMFAISSLNLSRSSGRTLSCPWKQGRSIPETMDISIKEMISSACNLKAMNPQNMSVLNCLKSLLLYPPSTSTYS